METIDSNRPDTAAGRRLRTLRDLPGPRPVPFLGNLHQLERGRMHRTLEQWAKQYGECFRVNFGPRRMLVVTDPALIGGLLRDRPERFGRTRRIESIFADMGFGGVFSANGEAWRRQRKIIVAAFAQKHLKAYFPAMARVGGRLYGRWAKRAAEGASFHLQEDLARFTVDVISGLAFGVDINTVESEGAIIQEHLDAVFPMIQRRVTAPVSYWKWVKFRADRELERHLAIVHREVAALVRAARDQLDARPELRERPTNVLQAMLAARDSEEATLSDYDISSNVLTLLLAGEDTTANTLAWMIYLVSRHPEVARKLHDEALAVLGPDTHVTRLEQLADLRYTEACALETMRLRPVGPLISLEASEPTVVGDVAVPAHTVILALLRPGATDARHFADAAEYHPERWQIDAEGSVYTAAERVSMPFGSGARICPGRTLALHEIKMVASMLFRNFSIDRLERDSGAEIEEHYTFTMCPSPMRMTLSGRT
jgi:cytochrome P450